LKIRAGIGIDISPTACRVMAKRLRDGCALPESECSGAPDAASSSARHGRARHSVRAVVVNRNAFVSNGGRLQRPAGRGLPTLPIPPFEFENWAVIALGGIGRDAALQRPVIAAR